MIRIEKGEPNGDNCKVLVFMTLLFGGIWWWSYANEKIGFGGKSSAGQGSTPVVYIGVDHPAYWPVMWITGGIVILVVLVTILECLGFHISFGKGESE